MPITAPLGQQQAFGSTGSSYGAETTTTTTANATTVLAAGWWMVLNGLHNTVQYTPDAGTTQRTLIAASAAGVIWSDGFNIRVLNDATGGTSSFMTFIKGQ